MIGSVLRVLLGFVVACLAAGLTMVLFVYTPVELATERAGDRVGEALLLSLAAATQSAIFAAPFAFIAAGFAEWQRIGSWLYYAIIAIVIACIGFLAQFWAETGTQPSIVNGYAVTAFVVTGLASGLAYWFCAGRFAAGTGDDPGQEVIPPPRSAPQPKAPEGPSARVGAAWRPAT
jgi:hypothetical protein